MPENKTPEIDIQENLTNPQLTFMPIEFVFNSEHENEDEETHNLRLRLYVPFTKNLQK